MDPLRDLKRVLAIREQEAADLYVRLPAPLKAEATRELHRGDVYPWQTVATAYPAYPVAQAFADLLMVITDLKVQLTMAELALKGPPDLTLVCQRKWHD